WHADPKFGKWSNDRSLSDAERDTLLAWVKDGCPKGDPKDLPGEKKFADGWLIGKPDVIFTTEEVKVPADAGPKGIKYKCLFAKTTFAEDRWIQAAEARPGARDVVHHIIVYCAENRDRNAADGIGNGWVAAYAPGDMPAVYSPGQAKKLPKG